MNLKRIFKKLRINKLHSNSHIQVIGLWILILLIASCKSSTPDSGFFDDNKSCLPPCWNDIVPGSTAARDAIAILFNSKHISQDSVDEEDLADIKINEYTFRLTEGSHGGVITRNDVVFEIYLTPEFKLTLKDIIERFGEPDYIFLQFDKSSEDVCFDTHLYYPDRGIMVQFNECEKIGGADHPSVISGDEFVNNLVYFPSSEKTYEEILLELWQPHEEVARYFSINSEPWDGFGVYEAKSETGLTGIPRPSLR